MTYFSERDFRRDNRGLFEKYVFCESPHEHSVRNDIVLKLSSLVGHPSAEYLGMLLVFFYSDLYPLPEDTFVRLERIAPAGVWDTARVPAWRNPDQQEVSSWVLPVYWERSGGRGA